MDHAKEPAPEGESKKQSPAQDIGNDTPTVGLPPGSIPSPGAGNDASRVDFGARYRVERLLGQGGMGAVYLAYDEELGRQVALKLVRPEFLVHPEAMSRFRQELLLASKISHRNILRLHDISDAGGTKFISMAYVDGEDLHQLLKREGKLPLDKMLSIARQLCAALEAAHSEGVVHRDLKPQNIMLGEGDHVFVTDFGLAKPMDVVSNMTQAGQMLGTPRYMAPEQVEAKNMDARTDIYALGLIFYEMLTGDIPFSTESTLQFMYKRAREVPPPPKTVVADIPDWMNDIIMKCLQQDPANRYQSATEILADIDSRRKPPEALVAARKRPRFVWAGITATAILSIAIAGWLWLPRRAEALTEKDTILIADFANSTGEAVFDDTLKQALVVGLGQSPFLSIVSDQKVRAALQQMTRPPGERLTEATAREVCQRTGSKAFIGGSIAGLGSQYVVGLNAVNCSTGEPLAVEQVQAAGKEKVLDALGKAVGSLRGKLGESLRSVQQFDVPLEQATTSSLEALKAFSMARKLNNTAAMPLYERVVELDPNFASAHLRLGITYANLGQIVRSKASIARAYELRERASEREKYHIASMYHSFGTGQKDKAIQIFTLWAQSYPRDWLPLFNMGGAYSDLGQYEKAVEATRESLRLYPDNVTAYENLGMFYLALNRFSEVREVSAQALARKLDEEFLHIHLYAAAFVQGDTAEMAKQVTWFAGKADVEHNILGQESDTEAYFGRLGKARDLIRQAIVSAERSQNKESASKYASNAALREALFGNFTPVRALAGKASIGASDREAALALALAGDGVRAQALVDEINKSLPLDTVVQTVWLPTIRGQLAINKKTPESALELLRGAGQIELGPGCLYSVYVRGQAYLASGQGAPAAAEFQRILDHRGLVQNCPTGALAHLGLARAYLAQKDTVKARGAYQEFLTLWKDADQDIPILMRAKAESAALK